MISGEDIAELEVVDFGRLQKSDPEEQIKALLACETRGFFILRLQHGNERLWKEAGETFEVAKEVFRVSSEDQGKFHMALSGVSELSG